MQLFTAPRRRLPAGLRRVAFLLAAALPPAASATAQSIRLPGHVVEVRAGEFFFQAPDTIPSGITTFRLTQIGMVADRLKAGLTGRALVADSGDDTRGSHMLWVVRLEDGKSATDLYRAALAGDRAPWAVQIGGPGGAHPPRTANATVELAPGSYALVCYIGSAREDRSRAHLLRGMFHALTVVAAAAPSESIPAPSVRARIVDDGVVVLSAPLTSGIHTISVTNETKRGAEFKFQRMPDGLTAKAFLAQPAAAGPAVPWGGLASVPPGRTVVTTIDFEPGEYVLGTRPAMRHATSRAIIVARPPAAAPR